MKPKTRKLRTETKSHSGRFACLLLLSCMVLSMSPEIGADNGTWQNAPSTTYSKAQLSGSSFGQRADSTIVQKLWQSRLSVPDGERNDKYRIELQRLIEQIRSVKFEPARRISGPLAAVELVPAVQSKQVSLSTDIPQEPVKEQIEIKLVTNLPYKPIAEDTLRMLEKMSQNPSQLYDPLALGEVLFLSGRLKKAAKFYRQAFERMERDDVASGQDRAWALFQTGNCLRYDDLPSAKKIYEQLLAEYPDSPWSDLVKARMRLIDWYLQVEPKSLVAEQGS
jgi:tetratricopeptide (TPR) repeat protein